MIINSGQFTSGASWSYTFTDSADWEASTGFDFLVFPGLDYHALASGRAEQVGNALVFEAGPLDPLSFGVASEDYQRLTCTIGGGCGEVFIEDGTVTPITRDTAPVPLPSMLFAVVACVAILVRRRA